MDKVFLGSRVSNLDTGELAARVSRVNLVVDSEHIYTAGDDSGRTVEKVCPWGTQAMADNILARLRDVDYRPYSGLDGLLDPAAEVGDGITVGGAYSVLAQTDILFDRHCTADVSAPGGDEAEDEYPYKSRARRQSDRQLARVYSVITKTSTEIRLLVADEVKGLEGQIRLTSTELTAQIKNTKEGLESSLQQTASNLSSQITSTKEGLESRINQTASSLTTEIRNTKEGLESKIEQTASSLSAQISRTDGTVLSLSMTADRLSNEMTSAKGDISRLQQTATEFSMTVTSQGGALSRLQQTVDGFRLDVQNGDSSSTLQLMSGRAVLSSAEIYLRGEVTLEDLRGEGRTVINGANISTGNIQAANVGVTGSFTVYNGWQPWGHMGYGTGYDGAQQTQGVVLSSPNYEDYLIVSTSGVRMQDAFDGSIWVTGGNCFSSKDMMTYSDRRMKEDIDHDLACYQKFFRALRPCRFLLNTNPAEGYHTGFIAQEVEEAMDAAQLLPMDFAGLGRVRLPDKTEGYALRYGAFTALNTYMIQELDKRIAALEAAIKKS